MNYHSDKWIMNGIQEHYNESLQYFSEYQIVGIFYQGSGNYGLDYEKSDIDTKLIVIPSFEDIAFNRKPVSTTHVRENDEHIDFKDIRLYMQTFRKQNLNFLEILFTDFKIVNPEHEANWNVLVDSRERIARYNPYQAIKSMKGIAMEKYHAMEHEYPSKIEILKEYGYDGKQLHHLQRIEDFIERYIAGESYEKCLQPTNRDFLLKAKNFEYSLNEARFLAEKSLNHILEMTEKFFSEHKSEEDPEVNALLDNIQLNIMKKAVKRELM